MATVEKRSKNHWRIGVRLPASQGRAWIRRTLVFPEGMSEAQQRARAILAGAQLTVDVAEGRVTPDDGPAPTRPQRVTVREFAEIWMREHVEPSCKPTTKKNYRHFLDCRILPALGDTMLDELTPIQLTGFINSVRADTVRTTAKPPELRKRKADRERPAPQPRQLSDRTVRHYYDCLDYMLGKAVQWKYLDVNPLERVDRPKVAKKRIKYLDDRQAVQLLRCLAEEESLPFRCAVLLALLCGLRLSEVGALRLDDVRWDECCIDIQRALKYTPEKGNYVEAPKTDAGIRLIDLPAGMMALLEETRKYHEDAARILGDRWRGCGRIACNWDGTPVHHDTPSKWFRKFADRHGFEGITFHALRHTHATLLFANNIDAVAVASRLGHEDASTTLRIYAHAIRRRDKESARVMQQLMDAAGDSDPGTDSPQGTPT